MAEASINAYIYIITYYCEKKVAPIKILGSEKFNKYGKGKRR